MNKKILKLLIITLTLPILSLQSCNNKNDTYVYYLNFKPEQNDAWQKLAKKYQELTGIEVSVLTAGSGQYETTLQSEMAKSMPPTIFQVNGLVGYEAWKEYCLDLTDTSLHKELISDDYALKIDNKVYGIGYVYEGYGLIVNKNLLNEAGYRIESINSFESLKKISEDITKQRKNGQIDFYAFSSAGLDSSSSWRFTGHLANLALFYEFDDDNIVSQPSTIKGTYLDNYKALFDLYINNSIVDPAVLSSKTLANSLAEFVDEKVVFYQNGTWEYNNVKSIGDENLGFIPIYAGIDDSFQGFCSGTENYWSINSKVSTSCQEASIDFLNWVITSTYGTDILANEMEFTCPFKNTKKTKNVLSNIMNEYSKSGCYNVSFAFNLTPNVEAYRNDLVSALIAYSANQNLDNWDIVKDKFVNGWKKQYDLAN